MKRNCAHCKKKIENNGCLIGLRSVHSECYELFLKATIKSVQSQRKKKPKKTYTNAQWRKKCVEKAKLIAKERDNYTCVECGRTKKQGYQIHGSHILPESKHHRMSCVPENIMAQCAQCHMHWHEHPLESVAWFNKQYPNRYKKLKKQDQQYKKRMTKPDYQAIYHTL